MFSCHMSRYYDREGYRSVSKKFEAAGDFHSANLAVKILRDSCTGLICYCETLFWFYQPAAHSMVNQIRESNRAQALAMGLHPRLGKNSPVAMLDQELVMKITTLSFDW